MTEDEVFSTQMTHHRFILSTVYFGKGLILGSIPPALSIHLSAQAITSITLSLPVPFIDPFTVAGICVWLFQLLQNFIQRHFTRGQEHVQNT